jgi:flavin-dependent dehydrogenase
MSRIPAWDWVDLMCSPRRTLLDKVLLDAARAAGAEVRENFITEDLLADGGTVSGSRGHEKGSPTGTQQARLVIGADGKHSTVARAVNAGSYRQTAAVHVLHLPGGRRSRAVSSTPGRDARWAPG